jgi:hypothetical protein
MKKRLLDLANFINGNTLNEDNEIVDIPINNDKIDETDVKILSFAKSITEGAKEEYEKYFNAKMKEYGIESPADIKDEEEKKAFFNDLKDGWDKEAGKPKK